MQRTAAGGPPAEGPGSSARAGVADTGSPPGPEGTGHSAVRTGSPATARPRIPDHELIRPIGAGSYGEVWLARSVLGAFRAVKIVHRRNFANDRPFEREFRGIQKFEPISRSHSSQVNILHVGRSSESFYYVMELADDAGPGAAPASALGSGNSSPRGENAAASKRRTPLNSQLTTPPLAPSLPQAASNAALDAYVPRTLKVEICRRGRIPVAECLDIGLALTTALAHLHNHSLVHRDVKPSNVIFINGITKLADIGLVTGFDATISCVGTEGFLPPEGPGTPQADIYALGKVLYEISTGKDRQDYPEPPTQLGEFADRRQLLELGEIIKKACAPAPAQRYQSAEAMQADLLLLKTGRSVRQAHQLERRLKVMTRFAVGVAAAMLLGVVPYALALKEASRARRAEADAKEKLWGSYLAQAQAGRYSRQAGRRFEGLEQVRKAAALRPSLELRNEAIACLALRDMRLAREFCVPIAHCADFDLGGWRYACREATGAISVRSLADGRELVRLPGSGAMASDYFLFSPSGRLLTAFQSGKQPDRVIVWDVDRAQAVLRLTNLFVRSPDFTSDEQRIVLCEHPNLMVVYDLAAGRRVASYPVPAMPGSFRVHPNGRQLAISYLDKTELRDFMSGTIEKDISAGSPILKLAWDPSGRWLTGGAEDGNDVVWDMTTGERKAFKAHSLSATDTQFGCQGRVLASLGWDGRLGLRELPDGNEICSLPATRYNFALSADSHWLGYGSSNDKVGLAEVALGEECAELFTENKIGKEPCGCAFSPDGSQLATAHHDGLRLWDVASLQQIAFHPTEYGLFSVRYNASRHTLVTSGVEGVKEWTSTGQAGAPTTSVCLTELRSLAEAPDNPHDYFGCNETTLAVASNRVVHLLALQTGQPTRQLQGDASFRFTALSPDGRWCAAGTWESTNVWIFDVRDGRQILLVPACPSTAAMAFSPDNRWLVLCGASEYRFITTGSWTVSASVPRLASANLCARVAFSPDCRMAAIAYSAQAVRLVDPATGREFATLEARRPDNIHSLAFSPDGGCLAVTTWTQPIQLWDLRRIRRELVAMNLDWELPPYPRPRQ